MVSNIGSIVLELQNEIVSSNCDVVNVLHRAHLIASKLKLTDFDKWIQYELNGYPDQESKRNPFCLAKMVKNPLYKSKLTNEQCSIFTQAGAHCEYAEKDDYPWGSVILENGMEKVVCKCKQVKCINYHDCRSDLFDEC